MKRRQMMKEIELLAKRGAYYRLWNRMLEIA